MNALDFRNVRFEVSLDPHLERDFRRGAAHAGTVQADIDSPVGGDPNQLNVATVSLNGWSNQVDDLCDSLFEGRVCGGCSDRSSRTDAGGQTGKIGWLVIVHKSPFRLGPFMIGAGVG